MEMRNIKVEVNLDPLIEKCRDLLEDKIATGEVGGNVEEQTHEEFEENMLGGAGSWADYSRGGCAIIYNGELCEILGLPYPGLDMDCCQLLDLQAECLEIACREIYEEA